MIRVLFSYIIIFGGYEMKYESELKHTDLHEKCNLIRGPCALMSSKAIQTVLFDVKLIYMSVLLHHCSMLEYYQLPGMLCVSNYQCL